MSDPFPRDVDFLLTGASELATPRGRKAASASEASSLSVVERGAVAALDGVIRWVGPESEVPPGVTHDPKVTSLDAGGGTILPGFVDPHTHAVFVGSREGEFRRRLRGESYAEIAAAGGGILSTVAATRKASLEELVELTLGRLETMLRWGTTTAEVKSGYGLDRDTELRQLEAVRECAGRQPVELVPTFLGAHSMPVEHREDRGRFLDLMTAEVIPEVASAGLAEFCDVFCEEGVFTIEESRRILEAAAEAGLGLKVHADEIEATGGAELAAELGAISAEHLIRASDRGIRDLAEAGVVAVLLPATSFFLMCDPAPGPKFVEAGCAIAVASDLNPGSSHTESMPLSVVLACLRNRLSPEVALTAATLNAAAAIGRADRVGSLEPGKQMDAVVLSEPSWLHLVYHFGIDPVRHVVKAGKVVVQDRRVVA